MAWMLACDIGTTTLKLGAIDENGRLVGLVRHEYDLDTPGPNIVELGPDVYWTFYRQGVRELLAGGDVDPAELKGISFSSQATTFLLRDASGRALGPFIVWLDSRADAEAAELHERFDTSEIYRRTGQTQLVGLLQAAKLRWLRRHRPDMLDRAVQLFNAEDDLIFRLSGEHATDPTLAMASGLYDMRAGAWWPEMCEAAGVSVDQLPRVASSTRSVGPILPEAADDLGLPRGVPVVAGSNDQLAGAISVGNLAPGVVSETTGTALAVVSTLDAPVDGLAANVPMWGHPAPGKLSILVFANTASIILKWFRQQFAADMDYDAIMAEVARIPIGSQGVSFFPHFAGTGSPDFVTGARGEIAGLGLNHTKFHIARALIESLVFTLRDLVDLATCLTEPARVIRSLGGASQSEYWLQMKADVLGAPVEKPDTQEAALLGAAMMASVGGGVYASLEDASAAMTRITSRFAPDPSRRDAYEAAYQRYKQLYERVCAAAV